MKKTLITLMGGAILASTLSADFARVEMGVGSWLQTPTGTTTTDASDGFLGLKGVYTSKEKESSEIYAWAIVKHPVPIIPNLRVEYLSLSDEAKSDVKVGNTTVSSIPTTLDMTQIDVIPYYNLLDNTFWITVDVGLDIKIIQADIDMKPSLPLFKGYSDSSTLPLPLGYVRARVQIPTTNLGIESDIKYLSFDGSTIYDARAKIDYTFGIFPIIQPAIEIGYRIQKFDIDADDTKGSLEFSGVYAGMMLRF